MSSARGAGGSVLGGFGLVVLVGFWVGLGVVCFLFVRGWGG